MVLVNLTLKEQELISETLRCSLAMAVEKDVSLDNFEVLKFEDIEEDDFPEDVFNQTKSVLKKLR